MVGMRERLEVSKIEIKGAGSEQQGEAESRLKSCKSERWLMRRGEMGALQEVTAL